MLIESFSLTELAIFISAVFAAFSGCIYSIQRSRCNTIDCWGIKCDRTVLDTPNAVEPNI